MFPSEYTMSKNTASNVLISVELKGVRGQRTKASVAEREPPE